MATIGNQGIGIGTPDPNVDITKLRLPSTTPATETPNNQTYGAPTSTPPSTTPAVGKVPAKPQVIDTSGIIKNIQGSLDISPNLKANSAFISGALKVAGIADTPENQAKYAGQTVGSIVNGLNIADKFKNFALNKPDLPQNGTPGATSTPSGKAPTQAEWEAAGNTGPAPFSTPAAKTPYEEMQNFVNNFYQNATEEKAKLNTEYGIADKNAALTEAQSKIDTINSQIDAYNLGLEKQGIDIKSKPILLGDINQKLAALDDKSKLDLMFLAQQKNTALAEYNTRAGDYQRASEIVKETADDWAAAEKMKLDLYSTKINLDEKSKDAMQKQIDNELGYMKEGMTPISADQLEQTKNNIATGKASGTLWTDPVTGKTWLRPSTASSDYQITSFKDANGNEIPVIFDKNTGTYKKIELGSSNPSQGIVGGFDISSYATDPSHENSVASILNTIGKFNSIADVDAYIKKVAPNSPITGQMISNTSSKYGIPWEMLVAMTQQDSSLGTKGLGAQTNNPGNYGNDDSGNIKRFNSWQEGLDAVGNWLNNHRASPAYNNNNAADWAKQIANGKAKLSDIVGNTDAETAKLKGEVVRLMANENILSKADAEKTAQLNDKIYQIDDLIKKTRNTAAVGPNPLARFSATTWATGAVQNYIGSVQQLVSKETMDTLLNLKKSGGTLGALSDSERVMLSSAASKIGAWAIKDKNGNVVGYNASEKDFKNELEKLKTITKRALEKASGSSGVINSIEQYLGNNPDKVDEYNILTSNNPNLKEDEIIQLLGSN